MIRTDIMTLPGYNTIESSPLPILRTNSDHTVADFSDNMPENIGKGFGQYTGFRVLPYKMQSHYKRSEELVSLKTIVYENDIMKATFLPEYGGRLYSLYNKQLDKELLSVNPVFQPANLALRNAWFSGGIEWNMSHYGHTYLTCEPLFFAECNNEAGETCLRLYEYERVKKLYYQIDFFLPEGADYLVTNTSISNPYDKESPLYYWSNTAVSELNHARVFSSTNNVVYVKPYTNENGEMVNTMGYGQLPNLDGISGDVSYPRNFERSNEYFYQTEQEEPYPFEAVGYDDGSLFYEFSTMPLRYRKMFCWGTHRGGTKWQNYLSHNDTDKYVEIQAGLFPTQLHSETIAAKSTISFMQVFGLTDQHNSNQYYGEHDASTAYVKDHIFSKHSRSTINSLLDKMTSFVNAPVNKHLHLGHGWGALELLRLSEEDESLSIPEMSFPSESLTVQEVYWLNLLEENYELLDIDLNKLEISYMIDPNWMAHIDKAINSLNVPYESLILHKALILEEQQYNQEALELLESHVNEKTSLIYYRTIGALHRKLGNSNFAKVAYEQAYEQMRQGTVKYLKEDFSLEYLELLLELNLYQPILDIFNKLSDDKLAITEEMYSVIAQASAKLGKWELVDQILANKPERIREGKNTLVELWFQRKAAELPHLTIEEVRGTYLPPDHIDFRMN